MSGPGPAGGGRPRLAAVPRAEEGPSAAPERSPLAARLVWVLAAALVAAAVGVAVEARRADRIQAELVQTQGRLRVAEARLSAYDAYLGAVRRRVASFRDQLDGLEGLLARDPAQGAPRE